MGAEGPIVLSLSKELAGLTAGTRPRIERALQGLAASEALSRVADRDRPAWARNRSPIERRVLSSAELDQETRA